MKFLVVLFAAVACASASGLLGAAPLVPRVQVAPTQVNIVKQPVTVQQPVSVPRSVPYPVRAVAYTAPAVASPIVHAAPALTYAAAAPALTTYTAGAPAITTYTAGAPVLSSYAAGVPAISTYAAGIPAINTYAAGLRTIAAPGLLASPALTLAH